MERIVSYGDVVVRSGCVTRYAWRKALKEKALRPLKMGFEYGRMKFLASHVEEVFGLPAGTVKHRSPFRMRNPRILSSGIC